MNNTGFQNEKALIEALHQKKYQNLNKNLQKLIAQSFQHFEGLIHCELEAGSNKSDIRITINQESHTYSVKKGRGNSIHQESIKSFLTYLKTEHRITQETHENLQRFIWADGTLDGTGAIKDRRSSKKFKKRYPEVIKQIQNVFDQIKRPLIQRFLIDGVKSESSAEFIYYGTVHKGTCCPTDDVLEWVSTHKSRATLHIGKLSFQAWNRNLKGKKRSEKKRGIIQLKWGGLKRDIKKIAKINLGKLQEINFTKTLNKKKNLNYWSILKLNPKEHYAIRIKYQKYGRVNQQKVWAKADAFIAKGFVPQIYLEAKNFFLDEDDIQKFHLTPVEHSGISIKQVNSHHYQIMKISPSTFEKLFKSTILAAGASMYYRKRKKLVYNQAILKGWNISEEAFFDYYSKVLQLKVGSVINPNCQSCLKKIKRYAKKELIKRIKNDKKLSDFIFLGKGNFKEPYTAPWLFADGKLQKNSRFPFTITTGSGRSKGKFTIVVKPK